MISCMCPSGRAAVYTVTIAAGMLTIILSAEPPQRTTDRATGPGQGRFAAPRTPWGDLVGG